TWTISPTNPPSPPVGWHYYQAADVAAGSIVGTYDLPFAPASVAFGVSPTLVLGENGTAFASGSSTTKDGTYTPINMLASFNISNGASTFTYQTAAQNNLSIISSADGNGINRKNHGSELK
ncbi:MAG TPA: hypothetical protein VMT53_07650, partial [Terriglobales bacterium]|nr:hypothetical protein [Terriglobales bacterium]